MEKIKCKACFTGKVQIEEVIIEGKKHIKSSKCNHCKEPYYHTEEVNSIKQITNGS